MARKTGSAPPSPSAGSRRERAYAYIRSRIISGELKPETPVYEVPIAVELHMSRTPVREAMGQLATEGLLEQTANRGTVVAASRRQDIVELYELREALEVYSVRKAAHLDFRAEALERWRSVSDELVALKNELEKAGAPVLDPDQMQRFVAADLGFHNTLMRLAANGRIVKVVNDTRLLIRVFGMQRPEYNGPTLARIHSQHQAILESVAAHNEQRAAELLTAHIRTSLAERLAAYDAWEREASFAKSLSTPLAPLPAAPAQRPGAKTGRAVQPKRKT